MKHQENICLIIKTTLKSVYMDMYSTANTLLVTYVAREAKRVAHPWSRSYFSLNLFVSLII